MKAVLCLLALSAVLVQSAVLEKASARANLNIGNILSGDRLLARQYLSRPGAPNTIVSQDFIYRGNATTRISAIRANEVGYSQWANIFLISGGLNQNNATLRCQSQRGYGFYYDIEIWGR